MAGKSGNHRIWHGMALIGAIALTGCGPGFAPAGVEIAVRRPPARRVEVRSTAPGPGYVWIDGHYSWVSGDYVWVSGRWEAPPQPTYRRWEPGHWAKARGGWYWVEGRWH